jgi:hypothetical protein
MWTFLFDPMYWVDCCLPGLSNSGRTLMPLRRAYSITKRICIRVYTWVRGLYAPFLLYWKDINMSSKLPWVHFSWMFYLWKQVAVLQLPFFWTFIRHDRDKLLSLSYSYTKMMQQDQTGLERELLRLWRKNVPSCATGLSEVTQYAQITCSQYVF